MSSIIDSEGNLVGVTVVQAGLCVVKQIKTKESDGYQAIQMGFEEVKPTRIKQPWQDCGRAGTTPKKFIREWRLKDNQIPPCKVGKTLTVRVFKEEDIATVSGPSKGKGFAGGMKRHGFSGFPAPMELKENTASLLP